jgi:tRNA-splicing ligase RtcB
MLHTGSRAIGQAIRDHHLARAREADAHAVLPAVDAATAAGAAYLADTELALAYARANRDAIVAAVADIVRDRFGVAALGESHVDCHHNFVRLETHGGERLWVHRKGACSAAEGEAGIIPGSMGSVSFHTSGRGHPDSLCSSSHGAGRAMSRDVARRAISDAAFRRQMDGVWFDHRQAARLRDEAPAAYKDIHAVMRAQRSLTRIVRTLRPLLSYKGA